MTRTEIDAACRLYLQSELSPEDFFNQYCETENKKLSYKDSELLICLFYELKNLDGKILAYAKKMEDLI